MEIQVVQVTKAHLDKMPELERAFYLHIGHLRNEVTMLQKFLSWTNNNRSGNQIVQNVNAAQSLMLVKLMAGKLW